MLGFARCGWLLVFASLQANGQTTQGLITGRITGERQGRGITARITCENLATHASVSALSGGLGFYALPLLPPGIYRLIVQAAGYQAAERYDLQLPVAGFLEQNFTLRPLDDIWETADAYHPSLPNGGRVVTAYGPDVSASQTAVLPVFSREAGVKGELDASVSYVANPDLIEYLPLAGRDVYALLALQPGVAADTATSRGLGLTVDGQRPSASNFLLDGLEINNYVTTGPVAPIAPEAIQEYRISTANFSAEYGGTSGYLANAVTRSGGNQFHGLAYYYFRSQSLDANGFQQNAHPGYSRPYEHETQPGISVSGPALRSRLFFSMTAEYDAYRSELDPETLSLPTGNLRLLAPAGSQARALLDLFPPPASSSSGSLSVFEIVRPPTGNDRWTSIPRLDWLPNYNHRVMFRALAAYQRRPYFDWSPYPGFTTPLKEITVAPAAAWTWTIGPATTNELRVGYSFDNLGFDRTHPDVPRLSSSDGTVLPGSPLVFSYRDRSRSVELVENWTRLSGRHVLQAGGGLLSRNIGGYLATLVSGEFVFASAANFAADSPGFYYTLISRQAATPTLPDYQRTYAYGQSSLYAQDSFRAGRRLTIEYGARYENFGAPRNTGPVKDELITLGPGADLPAQIAAADFSAPRAGDEPLFNRDNRNLSVRAGVSWSLRDDGRTLLHGGYGIFYDRPFDNLWLTLSNNNIEFAAGRPSGLGPLTPAQQVISQTALSANPGFPAPVVFQPGFRNGRVQEIFAGIEHRLTRATTLEVNGQSSLGRRLVTTDLVNRLNVPAARLNLKLPEMSYRADEGSSDYLGMTAALRYRSSRLQLQASYTWSHAIDNQSEPLAGDFFALDTFAPPSPTAAIAPATFTGQFQPAADRASSDFDQRQNLILLSTWQPAIPSSSRWRRSILGDWRISEVAAFRSGFPFSVTVPEVFSLTGQDYLNNSANLAQPDLARAPRTPAGTGGVQLLNAAGFGTPAAGQRGNLGRNAFSGPGLYSVDVSLSRSFRLAKLPENWRLTIRADAYNALNHANLGNPCGLLIGGCGGIPFGVALYGRLDNNPGYPAAIPLNETARKIQALIRLSF